MGSLDASRVFFRAEGEERGGADISNSFLFSLGGLREKRRWRLGMQAPEPLILEKKEDSPFHPHPTTLDQLLSSQVFEIFVKFYLTTPIYYVNDQPHLGHAYTTIVADMLARYWRWRGTEVFFLTGTDENSQKNVEAAQKTGEDPQTYVNRMSAVWQSTWGSLDFIHNDFIRTTEARHRRGVELFWQRVERAGDIYPGTYRGWYCVGCEAFVTATEAVDDQCPIHKRPLKKVEEENYFFRLTKYRPALLAHLKTHPEFVQPESRREEITRYIKDFMTDISISRQGLKWGLPVPQVANQVIYVWFDALINYLTGIGFGQDEEKFNFWWPADLQLVGKDILKFHAALWPAMLMSAGLPCPKKIFAHGYFTVNGEKMSKTLGNMIDPLTIVKQYDGDTLRYYLLRDLAFGEDGDFSLERLAIRYQSELANELGNLVYRVLTLTEKHLGGKAPRPVSGHLAAWGAYETALEELRPHQALSVIWSLIREANRFLDQTEPWKLAKIDHQKMAEVLYVSLETLRQLAYLLWPMLPETSRRIFASLGLEKIAFQVKYEEAKKWGQMIEGTRVTRGEILFPKKVS